MKIDFPVAPFAILPGKQDRVLCLGLSTREIDVETLEGNFQVVATIRLYGHTYTIRAEDAGGPYYVEVSGVDRWGHLKFEFDGAEYGLTPFRCYRILASTLRGSEKTLSMKWNDKFGSSLRDIGKMRLRGIDTDLVEEQARLFCEFSEERFRVINGIVHRLIDEPLIVVGPFPEISDVIFDWDDRPEETLACYALHEWQMAAADAQTLAKSLNRPYDTKTLRNLVKRSLLDRDVLDRRAGLLCHWFCYGLQSQLFPDIGHGFKLASTFSPEDRLLLQKIAQAASGVDNGRFEKDITETGERVLYLDDKSPLHTAFKGYQVSTLAKLLKKHDAPRISIDVI